MPFKKYTVLVMELWQEQDYQGTGSSPATCIRDNNNVEMSVIASKLITAPFPRQSHDAREGTCA